MTGWMGRIEMKGLAAVAVQMLMQRFVERVCVEIAVEIDEVLV